MKERGGEGKSGRVYMRMRKEMMKKEGGGMNRQRRGEQ